MVYIVADVGGTKTRIAGSLDLESFGEPIIFDTPQSYDDWLLAFVKAAKTLANGNDIQRTSLGQAGVISKYQRSLIASSHLKQWVGRDIAGDVERSLASTACLENDTALVGLGEAVYGVGKGAPVVMYITVSTGVGGVRIENGYINLPARSAEVGQQYRWIGGKLQTLENLVSGFAIETRFGKHPRELGKEHPVWEELAETVAVGVHNSILHWTPDRIVLGGSMFNEIGISVDRVREHLKEILKALPEVPEVVHSQLGDLGGLWGGLARLKQLQS